MDGIVHFQKPISKLLDKFILSPPHGMILGDILLMVLLVFPLVLESILKGLVAQDRVISEVFVPLSSLSGQSLGK